MDLPSPQQLEEAYQEAARIHKVHLDQHKVHLPNWPTYKAIHLAMLMHHKDRFIHKDDVSDAVQRQYPEAGRDQQVRHLKRDGWNIESDGHGNHRIRDPYNPSPEFVNLQARRQGLISATDFEDIVRSFGNRCATCGAISGEPDPRYGNDIISLQRGHMNPNRPDDLGNTIPQCPFCNQAYKDDYVFDEKGRVKAVANIGPIKRASRTVQKIIYEFLKERFEPPRS